jgi:hypothetical protein
VAIRAQQDALPRFLAHPLERSSLPAHRQTEGLRGTVEVMELEGTLTSVISADRTSTSGLLDQFQLCVRRHLATLSVRQRRQ